METFQVRRVVILPVRNHDQKIILLARLSIHIPAPPVFSEGTVASVPIKTHNQLGANSQSGAKLATKSGS
jgi:hypothetical protein